jgi:hypothetical protein
VIPHQEETTIGRHPNISLRCHTTVRNRNDIRHEEEVSNVDEEKEVATRK